jgi:transcriptional regulator with XRE-family HTH domain
MRTKPARSDEKRIRAFHEKLDQPSIVEIDDATAYWLEGEDGRKIGEQSPTSEAPLLAALAEIRRGVDPIELSLVCNAPDEGAPDDGRYVISTGVGLLWMAESAAGLPPRPRGPAVGELSGRSGGRSLPRRRIGRPLMRSIDILSTRAKVIAMDSRPQKPISPVGQTSDEAAAERYDQDAAYRAAHDRLAPYRVIARAVILARVGKRLTQRDLAGMLGTTDSAISRIESGERAISLETLRKLGVALDIVFLVGSTDAATADAADPRAVVVPEAPIETTSVKEPRQAASTPYKRSVKLARGGGLAIPAVPAPGFHASEGS